MCRAAHIFTQLAASAISYRLRSPKCSLPATTLLRLLLATGAVPTRGIRIADCILRSAKVCPTKSSPTEPLGAGPRLQAS